jgi:hypothetical protein
MSIAHMKETLPNGRTLELTYTQEAGESAARFLARVGAEFAARVAELGG